MKMIFPAKKQSCPKADLFSHINKSGWPLLLAYAHMPIASKLDWKNYKLANIKQWNLYNIMIKKHNKQKMFAIPEKQLK